ncbi:hypothetical protein OG298_45205 (plasmid) [Streptomyces sp. NBC_01005]|nr:hypothetical protein OG298_45205 [Streptomyces sp. NBC_01005]
MDHDQRPHLIREQPDRGRNHFRVPGDLDNLVVPVIRTAVHSAPDQRRGATTVPGLRVKDNESGSARARQHVVQVEPAAGHLKVMTHMPPGGLELGQ